MDGNFYKGSKIDFKYQEIGICLEDTKDRTAKIAIPIATPTLPMDDPYDNKDLKQTPTNILSDTRSLDISPCTVSNYITMNLPDDIESLSKGDKVILIFIGGDINCPVILRRW